MAFETDKFIDDIFAYDLSKNIISKGEVLNEEAINGSINNILATIFTERLFNASFGSYLQLILFDTISTTEHLESILNSIIKSIKDWEPRVTVIEKDCKLSFDPDYNILSINVVYVINKLKARSSYISNIRVGL